MQHNLGLIELLLNLHDAVGLLRVLVLGEVLAELGEGQLGLAGGPRGAGVLGQELVDNLAEQLVGDEAGVLVIRDDDSADALGAAVGVEGVICLPRNVSRRLQQVDRPTPREVVTLLFDVLSLARAGALGDRLRE